MAGYIGSKASVATSGVERKKTYTITTTTTSLTALNYTVGKVHVFQNGVRLLDGTDYTATDGTTITLTVAAENGDNVVVISQASYQVALSGIDDQSNATAITIDSSENVGIGTSSPSQQLHISGTDNKILVESTNYAALQLKSGSTRTFNIQSINDASGALRIYDATADAERMRIDSSGNVGIGASTLTRELTVSDTASRGEISLISSTTQPAILLFGDSDSDSVGQIRYDNADNSLAFHANNAEHMRIDSSGNLLVSKTALSTSTVGVQATAAGGVYGTRSSGSALIANRLTTTGAVATFMYNTATVGTISVTGSATAYNTSSDYRLKEAWVPMTGASERVQALKPINFAWKLDGSRVDGFLAHELADVVPEATTGTKDAMRDEEYEVTPAIEAIYDAEGIELTAAIPAVMGTRSVPDYQGIDQSKLVPLLTAALQEALTEIADLKARVTTLEAV